MSALWLSASAMTFDVFFIAPLQFTVIKVKTRAAHSNSRGGGEGSSLLQEGGNTKGGSHFYDRRGVVQDVRLRSDTTRVSSSRRSP